MFILYKYNLFLLKNVLKEIKNICFTNINPLLKKKKLKFFHLFVIDMILFLDMNIFLFSISSKV